MPPGPARPVADRPRVFTRPRLAIGALALLALVVGTVAFVAGTGDGERDGAGGEVDQSRPGTVLLLPGYGGDVTDLASLAGLLRARGRTVAAVRMPGAGTGDLREQARAVQAAATAAIDAGAPSVDVVGYSAGGIVARVWVADFGGADIARRVVTLGSPHHGTNLAALAGLAPDLCPDACRQLAPGSSLLAALPEPPAPGAGGPVWASIWSGADEAIVPPTSSVLAGAVDVQLQRVCADDRTAHSQLPRAPLVAGIVLRALDVTPMTTPPAATDCASLRATS